MIPSLNTIAKEVSENGRIITWSNLRSRRKSEYDRYLKMGGDGDSEIKNQKTLSEQ
jgi:hypothetical protein